MSKINLNSNTNAAFLKYDNKTVWPLEPTYVVLCGVFISSAFEERSTKAWFRESLNECNSLNSHNKISYGSTRPFIATCFFANCHIDLNHV